MVFMIEKLLALAPKSTNRQLHFFVPFNFGVYSFPSVLQILMKPQTLTMNYMGHYMDDYMAIHV